MLGFVKQTGTLFANSFLHACSHYCSENEQGTVERIVALWVAYWVRGAFKWLVIIGPLGGDLLWCDCRFSTGSEVSSIDTLIQDFYANVTSNPVSPDLYVRIFIRAFLRAEPVHRRVHQSGQGRPSFVFKS